MTRILIYLLLLSGLFVRVTAKSYLYDNRLGLSSNFITCIVKDKQGKLWVGTQKGLNTFDGHSFYTILGLENQTITQLLSDSVSGNIWIATPNGLFMTNPSIGNLIKCTAKIKGDNIRALTQYGKDIYVVFSDGRILAISPEFSCRFTQNTIRNELGNPANVAKAVFDNNGYAYLNVEGSEHILTVHLVSGNKVNFPFATSSNLVNMFSGHGSCILSIGSKGIMLLGIASKGYKSTLITLPESHRKENVTYACQQGNLYYIGLRGICYVYKIDSVTHSFVLMEERSGEYLSRIRDLSYLCPDGTNVMWIGTNKGLVKEVVTSRFPFSRILTKGENRISVRQISKANPSELYFATYDGIFAYSLVTGQTKLRFPKLTRSFVIVPPYLYLGREYGQYPFMRVHLQSGKADSTFFGKDSTSANVLSIFRMYHASDGILWMATNVGLACYNLSTSKLSMFGSDLPGAPKKLLKYLAPNRDSTQLIAAGSEGMFIINLQTQTVQNFSHSTNPNIPEGVFWYCEAHPNGSYWFGTQTAGIVSLSEDLKTVNTYDTKNGLSSNEVYSVIWYDSNEAWVTTSSGLNRFDLEKQTFDNYYYDDGIADDEFNQNSTLLENGKIYAGGIDGVTVFAPKDIEPRNRRIHIFSSGVSRWGNNSVKERIVDMNNPIEMSSQFYLLRFSFGLSDYSTTEDNNYYYQIKGIHKEWVPLGPNNILNIEGLREGSYDLEVIGFNKFGNRSLNTLKFTLSVIPVYYKTVWFYGLLALVVLILVVVYYRWRLNMIGQKHELRTAISSNLHDEVGSLLTSIIVSTDNARYSATTLADKDERLLRISDLSRNAINTMSDVLWSIDAHNDKVGSFTDRMQEHVASMFDDTLIEVRFKISEADQNQPIEPYTRQQLYLIFKEALNNVLKHSRATNITIVYAQKGKHFELVIENNQSDLTKSGYSTGGQGIRNMKMRAQKIDAKFSIEHDEDGVFRVKVVR